jgi:glycosyltransferase involved in cell wall biosynthesis
MAGSNWSASRTGGPETHLVATPPILRMDLVSGALRKAAVALIEGRLPLSPRRWYQLYRLHLAEQVEQALMLRTTPLPPMARPETRDRPGPPGLTIVGYLSEDTGVGAGAHGSIAACREADVAFELIDAARLEPTRGTHPVSLLHVNADETASVAAHLGAQFFRGRYTIGRWAWELEELPDEMVPAFAWLDEIWAMSSFIQQSIAEKSPVPVVHIPLPVTVAPTAGLSRRAFGIPEHQFVFLVMYDVWSIQERKNPLGALRAFARAFQDRSDACLIVRINHADTRPEDAAIVRRGVEETRGARLIDWPMPRGDAQALQAVCDAFVSLHRSEGFGLNIAEAMLLGKPVVVTGWSGNLDFTGRRNACVVDYELLPLTEDHGPYRKGNRWAEPNLDEAAELMVRLVDDRVFRRDIALRGQATITTDFSPRAIGVRYRRRLARLGRSRSVLSSARSS